MEMQQPESQPTSPPAGTQILDPADQYQRRRRTALWMTVALLVLALVVLTVGLVSATRTDNVPVSGYYPGISLSCGAFLGIIGIHLVENRRPMLIAAIIFISIGVIVSFLCAIVDGIIASEYIDIRPLQEDMCDFYSSASGYFYDNYYTEVTCRSFNKACQLKMKSNTCYCCYLYNCESTYEDAAYFAFTGVSSCWDVIHLYRLMWTSVVLNIMALILGIITAAILGAYKDIQKPTAPVAPSPAPPPHILYNPTQHMLTYAGFCPGGQALPAYPNYPIPMQMQHNTNFQQLPTPQMMTDTGLSSTTGFSSTTCPSEENQHAPQPQPQEGTQETGGFTLTPNAPVFYGPSFGGFEKPPPYAC
uniref:Transmembrane protein 255B n=1 Tax=Cynoglossus semilaevis TaxID=244447 RepID=A0A3P8V3W2_CYNSE